jgi:RNA polymerase sigma-70 factor (ECF subfamily)
LDLEHSDKYQLEKLFDDYYTAVLLYCISIVKDKHDAEDIVQQAFISLWRKTDSIDFHTSARAYLYRSVYNASLDWIKHQKVRKRYENEVKNYPIVHAVNNEERDLSGKIVAAIDDLPDQCRRIFKMNRYDQLRYKDIAETLQISEKTVEKHMVKALRILRERLKDYLPLILPLLLNFFL